MNKKLIRTVLFGLTAIAVLMPMMAFALPTPTPPVTGNALTLVNIQALIERIAQFLIIVSMIIAIIFIIWGGILYMAARGDDAKAETAKTTIYNGVIGAAVVLGVGVILQTLAGIITRTFFV